VQFIVYFVFFYRPTEVYNLLIILNFIQLKSKKILTCYFHISEKSGVGGNSAHLRWSNTNMATGKN